MLGMKKRGWNLGWHIGFWLGQLECHVLIEGTQEEESIWGDGKNSIHLGHVEFEKSVGYTGRGSSTQWKTWTWCSRERDGVKIEIWGLTVLRRVEFSWWWAFWRRRGSVTEPCQLTFMLKVEKEHSNMKLSETGRKWEKCCVEWREENFQDRENTQLCHWAEDFCGGSGLGEAELRSSWSWEVRGGVEGKTVNRKLDGPL